MQRRPVNEISRRVSSSSSLLFLLLPSHATACVGDVHARCSIFFLAAELCSISESFQAARRKKLKDKLAQYKLRVELVRLVLLCFCRSACVHPSTHVHACILCMRACVHVGRKVQGVFFFCDENGVNHISDPQNRCHTIVNIPGHLRLRIHV